MSVASGINAFWTGTHAGIPSGWSRNTALDDKYVLGASAGQDGGGAGGQATHSHTVQDHVHALGSHSHMVYGFNGVGSLAIDEFAGGSSQFDVPGHNQGAKGTPTEAGFNSSNNASSVSMDAQSNDPPYVAVIFIESGGAAAGIPNEASVLWEDTGVPSGWAENDGGGSRTDLRDKFLKGAATSADAGGTGGSSNSHTHTEDGTKHTHAVPGHDHGGSMVSGGSDKDGYLAYSSTSPGNLSHRTHDHNLSLATNSPAMELINVVQTAKITSQSGDAQPPFTKLRAIENGNGADDLPDGIVCLWFGTRATIPAGWVELDGASTNEDMRGQFLKCANGAGQIGDTGGSDQHTHTANSHTHDLNHGSHAHTVTGGAANQTQNSVVIVESNQGSSKDHTHTWIMTNSTPSLNATTVTINNNTNQTNYPSFVKGIFVKYDSTLIPPEVTRAVHKMHLGLGFGPGFRR